MDKVYQNLVRQPQVWSNESCNIVEAEIDQLELLKSGLRTQFDFLELIASKSSLHLSWVCGTGVFDVKCEW